MFIGAGTGGTITGIARKLKELDPNIKIIGIDPYGSDLALPKELNDFKPEGGYQVEGIGYDFIPRVLDRSQVDEWIKTDDVESFECARRLICEEGFLCGGSSGTALAGALRYIKQHNIGEGKRCVFLCPDNIRNYLTKFINNDWMCERGFMTEEQCMEASIPKLIPHNVWGTDFTIKDLPLTEAVILDTAVTCRQAINITKEKGQEFFPVKCKDSGKFLGMVRPSDLITKLAGKKCTMDDSVLLAVNKLDYRKMSSKMPLSELARVFEKQQFVFVDDKYIVTNMDLLNFMNDKM